MILFILAFCGMHMQGGELREEERNLQASGHDHFGTAHSNKNLVKAKCGP